MVSIVQRARIGIEDRLRFSKGLRWAAARWRVARGGRHDGSEPAVVGRIASLCS